MSKRKNKSSALPKLLIGIIILSFAFSLMAKNENQINRTANVLISNYESGDDIKVSDYATSYGVDMWEADIKQLNKVLPKGSVAEIIRKDSTYYVTVTRIFKSTSLRLVTRKAERRMKCKK